MEIVNVEKVCYLCSEAIKPEQPRQLNEASKLYRHTNCTIRGKCPHCKQNVIMGMHKRSKTGKIYWHSVCLKEHEEDKPCPTAATLLGTCCVCDENVLGSCRRHRIEHKDGKVSYRHEECAKRGKCPFCQKDVTSKCGRTEVRGVFWHTDCYTPEHAAACQKR